MRKVNPSPPGIIWRYNEDPPGEYIRVWRADWFGDQFEIVDKEAFFTVIAPAFMKLGFMITRAEDD